MKYPAPPVMQLVPKHGLKDCVVAAVASYLCRPFEEVAAAASRSYPNFWKYGLENKHITTIARRLKTPIKWARDYDIDDDTGVLAVNYIVGTNEHVVLLVEGRIVELEDKTITFWEPSAYLAAHGARAGLLMVRK